MRNLIKTFLVMLMLSFSHAAIAGDLEDGFAAAQKGDFATALRLWKPLAEQGDAKAQTNLGVMYDNGQAVAQDYKTAVKWYTLAAEQGNAKAQYNLGIMYETGKGVAQDYVKAHMWYNIAAIDGNADAIKNRDDVAKKMTSAQIEKAQQLATRCMKSSYKDCD